MSTAVGVCVFAAVVVVVIMLIAAQDPKEERERCRLQYLEELKGKFPNCPKCGSDDIDYEVNDLVAGTGMSLECTGFAVCEKCGFDIGVGELRSFALECY